MTYKKVQFSPFILMITLLSVAIIVIASLPEISYLEWSVIVLLLSVACLFSTMTVIATEERVQWFFGPKFWKKTLKMDDVLSINVLPAKWYHGFGIRLRSSGWLYRVGGTAFVEIALKNGTTVSLGTNCPSELSSFILNGLENRHL